MYVCTCKELRLQHALTRIRAATAHQSMDQRTVTRVFGELHVCLESPLTSLLGDLKSSLPRPCDRSGQEYMKCSSTDRGECVLIRKGKRGVWRVARVLRLRNREREQNRTVSASERQQHRNLSTPGKGVVPMILALWASLTLKIRAAKDGQVSRSRGHTYCQLGTGRRGC